MRMLTNIQQAEELIKLAEQLPPKWRAQMAIDVPPANLDVTVMEFHTVPIEVVKALDSGGFDIWSIETGEPVKFDLTPTQVIEYLAQMEEAE